MKPARNAPMILLVATCGCLADEPLKLPLDITPRQVAGDWPTSTPEAQGINAALLGQAFAQFGSEDRFRNGRSLLVIRNGTLVAEAYVRDERDLASPHHVKSVTKSVTSLLVGIARDQGHFPDLRAPLQDVLPRELRFDDSKRAITLEHALTMRSGIDWTNDVHTGELMTRRPHSSLQFVLDRPQRAAPGARFHYHDGDPHLVGAAIQTVTGEDLLSFARRHLFEPIGIRDARWERHRDGMYYAAYGLWLRPRDMARIGQLVLQNGVWDGKRVVTEQWLRTSTQPLVGTPASPYGIYWWIRPGLRAIVASGHGGQYIYVMPDRALVIVMTAEPYAEERAGTDLTRFEELVAIIHAAAG
jgi:CubicO group peptidase (beta-lactamase class C family)